MVKWQKECNTFIVVLLSSKMAKWLHECNTTSFLQFLIENGKMEKWKYYSLLVTKFKIIWQGHLHTFPFLPNFNLPWQGHLQHFHYFANSNPTIARVFAIQHVLCKHYFFQQDWTCNTYTLLKRSYFMAMH
jgi:hypothetical protein